LAEEQRSGLLGVVGSLAELATVDRAKAVASVAAANGALSRGEQKAVLEALVVRDPDAPALGEPDPELRDQENVPLPSVPVAFEPDVTDRLAGEPYRRAVDEYMDAEVLPYVPDAWVDFAKTKIGYEIPLTRHFYKYVPPRPLAEIDAEIRALEREAQELLGEVTHGQ
jgi:type I restriction enzyme M protein